MDIDFYSVKKLLGMQFYIPSYQRGYRWTEDEVLALLNDLSEYADSKKLARNVSKFYCLQPLVIKKQGSKYEVIDGQQRLTTIYLILKALEQYAKDALGVENFTLLPPDYATRTNCISFFKTEAFKKPSDENLDFLHLSNAYNTITKWFDSPRKKNDIFDILSSESFNAQFIWYVIDDKENAYEVFKRLNSGKLSLTNSELVKALILNDEDKDETFNQEDVAREWENIENHFENDDLWYFINSEPEATKYESTRMDFLLEIILLKNNIVLKDNYFIFSEFNEKIKKDGWKNVWEEIKSVYRTIQTWYNDRKLYHYIGFLINARSNSKISISELLKNYEEKSKDIFFSWIKDCCKTILMDNDKEVNYSKFIYGKANDKIHNILLLFNLATTQNQISETSRYPFKKHFEASKNLWSLEHIHAQNERQKNWSEEEILQLKTDINNIARLSDSDQKQKLIIFSDYINSENLKDEQVYRSMMAVFMGEPIVIEKDKEDAIISVYSDFEKDDTLMNLALLQADKNASFNNKTFLEKRRILAKYENATSETQFIPICTRNVFFKHYSPDATNPLIWDREAGKDYVRAMMNVIGNFIGVTSFNNFDNLNSKEIEFGLIRK